MSKFVCINGVATTNESSYVMNAVEIFLVSNDNSSTGDLYLDFAESVDADTNYLVLKPGEQFRNLDISCKTLYVKASTGSVNFRCYGRKFRV